MSGSLFYPEKSWVHRADPRVKMLFVAALWGILFSTRDLRLLLGILLLLHGLHLSARIPPQKILFIWKAFLPLAILIPVLWAFFNPAGPPVGLVGSIRFYPQGLLLGAALVLRLVALAFGLFAWLYTTDPNAVVLGFVKLRVPYAWGLIFTLVMHFIPVFQNLFREISEAQQARGLMIAGSGLQRVRKMMPIFVTMVIGALKTSDQLTRTLEARAFGGRGIRRTYLQELRFEGLDYFYSTAILLITIAFFLGN